MLRIPHQILPFLWRYEEVWCYPKYKLHIAAPVCGHSLCSVSIQVCKRFNPGYRCHSVNVALSTRSLEYASGCQFPFFFSIHADIPRLRQKHCWYCCIAVSFFTLQESHPAAEICWLPSGTTGAAGATSRQRSGSGDIKEQSVSAHIYRQTDL